MQEILCHIILAKMMTAADIEQEKRILKINVELDDL